MADEWGVLAFPDPPVMIPLGGDNWKLAADYIIPAFGFSMRLPGGFVTDRASVPRLFWPIISPADCGAVAPVAHDWLYQHGGDASGLLAPMTRRKVDSLFRLLMRLERVLGWRRWAAWAAVRLAGWACWHKSEERIEELQSRGR